jgi:predicted nucleic acid-binding protein
LTGTFIDTNILIDIATSSPAWQRWSSRQLDLALVLGPALINDIVFAECSIRLPDLETAQRFLKGAEVTSTPTPPIALFLAGKVFQRYRNSGGTKNFVLPDFFIGAHAFVAGIPLLTRDTRRYKTYFPNLNLISPDMPLSKAAPDHPGE